MMDWILFLSSVHITHTGRTGGGRKKRSGSAPPTVGAPNAESFSCRCVSAFEEDWHARSERRDRALPFRGSSRARPEASEAAAG